MRTTRALMLGLLMLAAAFGPVAAEPITLVMSDGTQITKSEKEWAAHYEKVLAERPFQRMQLGTDINFEVTYADDGTGAGFDDPTLGPARKALFDAVLVKIDEVLDHNGTAQIEVNQSLNNSSLSLLASAGPFLGSQNGINIPLSLTHITTGSDPGPTPDISVTVNFGYDFHLGDPPVPTGEFDLYSVLLHEMTHGLGFVTLVADETGISDRAPANAITPYDALLWTGTGVKLWNDATGVYQGDNDSLLGGDGGAEFRGSEATAVFGEAVPIYVPPTFQVGSSVAHWADGTGGGDSLMQRSIGTATARRDWLDFELGSLADLGYTLQNQLVNQTGHWLIYE